MKVRIVWKTRSSQAERDAPPQSLVDVCSHILWGLEYGLIDLDRTLSLLKVAAAHGTTDIVVTPRTSVESQFDPETATRILKELSLRSDGWIRIHASGEFLFGYSNAGDVLRNPQKYTINGLRYLPVDFANSPMPPAADEILFQFRKEGLIPIISHPERNAVLRGSMERLKAWISMGCVLQVTTQSLSGKASKIEQRCAWDLLHEDMVFAVASGGRDLKNHPPRLDREWRSVRKRLGEDIARRLFIENPSMIIQGGTLERKPAGPVTLDWEAKVG